MYQPPRRDPEIDLEQILNRIRAALSAFGNRFGGKSSGTSRAFTLITFGILGLAFIIWMATGIYTVGAGEQAVLRTFGKVDKTAGPGLNWHFPAPIGTRNVESIQEVRSMELGFSARDEGARAVPEEALMIAGDLNIVDVQLVVQYRISNLENFLFKVSDPGEGAPNRRTDIAPGRPEGRTLKDATEAALRLVVGQRPIDDVLTEKKEAVQGDTQELLQQILDSYGSGLQILSVRLQEVKPPEDVRPAFDDVLKARQDKERFINEAQGFARDIIPRARGEAEKIIQAAVAFKRERVAKATGESERFLSILREFEKAPDVTRQRLYLEAMEEILPGISKFVISPEAQGTIILNAGGQQIVPVPEPLSITGNGSPTSSP